MPKYTINSSELGSIEYCARAFAYKRAGKTMSEKALKNIERGNRLHGQANQEAQKQAPFRRASRFRRFLVKLLRLLTFRWW